MTTGVEETESVTVEIETAAIDGDRDRRGTESEAADVVKMEEQTSTLR